MSLRRRLRPSFLRALFCGALTLIGCSGVLCAEEVLRIGRIDVDCVDVYSQEEAARGFAYRAADAMHVRTRPGVVRGFLLFREGDVYRPERIAETERNLRALPFLKSASVAVGEPHDGVVDINVTTQDTWSLAPGTEAGMRGGSGAFGMQITDSNVGGLGQFVSLSYHHNEERSRTALDFRSPFLLVPYWQSRVVVANSTDGYQQRVSVSRPFYSVLTPWAAEFSFDNLRQARRVFADGVQTDRYNLMHRTAVVAFGRAFDINENVARRLTFGIRTAEDSFTGLPDETLGIVPANQNYRYLFLRFEGTRSRFLTLDYVDRDMRLEDFDVGDQISLEAAISPRFTGTAANTGYARASAATGHAFSSRSFVLFSLTGDSRLESGPRNAVATASVRFVRRLGTVRPHTFVARLVANSGWRLDRGVQFFADGETGLRGYRLHAFEGARNIIINAEHRIYIGRELAQIASPGIVFFADAGRATSGGFRELMKMRSDVGVGLRIGLPRTPKNVIRFDLAMPLNPDAAGRRRPILSISSGQAF